VPFDSRDLGPLPVDLVNHARGTELEPGRARLFKPRVQENIEERRSVLKKQS